MIHPSYNDLMQVVNRGVEEGEAPLVNSRYSIVLATAKRARQIINGSRTSVEPKCNKPLSIAVQEVYEGKVTILPDDYVELEEEMLEEVAKSEEMDEEISAEENAEAAVAE